MIEKNGRLAVIIVNYNVRYFLEQALLSVRRAMRGIEGEVWVVDNHSVDDSVQMVREKFPEVRLIANEHNPGFSTANNQAIRLTDCEYVLLLNPDTVVEEDTLRRCVEFMQTHPDAGAVGVKLIDGSGKFLPESKRGFPSPWVSFCKTVGLSALFPHSQTFNGYYLGHLDPDQTHPVDVLVGAFMFMRKAALDKAGLLDEAFFMYGEDIDLSYRITLAGFRNYYFPDTKIIHYKGESTKKGSLNYVRAFYQAMIIFVRKHMSGRKAAVFVYMLQMAIWLRAAITLGQNFLRRIWLPLLDAALIFVGLVFLKDFWANYFYHDPHYFKPSLIWFNYPLYILIWIGSVWITGGYDEKYDLRRLVRGLALGTLTAAAVYGFLDLEFRPSRALIVLGAAWSVAATAGLRAIMHFKQYRNLRIGRERVRNLLIIGSESESRRVRQLLAQAGVRKNIVETIHPDNQGLKSLDELARVFRVEEIIFCSKDLPSQEILTWMTRLGPQIAYKILPEESLSIIGSSSKDEPGELYTIDIRYNLAHPRLRRNKRILDLIFCGAILALSPFIALFSKHKKILLYAWTPVLLRRKTWVGYAPHPQINGLPPLPAGVFSPLDTIRGFQPEPAVAARLNFLYAKDWQSADDIEVMLKCVF